MIWDTSFAEFIAKDEADMAAKIICCMC